jgi:RNA polymerase-binding transcription factor DksA
MTRSGLATRPWRLDSATLATLRAGLQEHRRFRLDQLREIRCSAATVISGSPSDASRALALAEVGHQLVVAARLALSETNAALIRMDQGRYGTCQRCGTGIRLERLYAYPQARYCGPCHRVEGALS